MAERVYRAAGLMIGTSLDGIDVALVEFDAALRVHRLVAHQVLDLRATDVPRLRAIAEGDATRAEELSAIRFALVDDHERAVRSACRAAAWDPECLDWIGVHGVTLWHAPGARGGHGWQLFAGPALAARVGAPVAHDFRSADIALGGQGAPLAPVADLRLRSSADEDRAVVNLGGIANASLLPAGGETVYAADVGPANMPLDELVHRAHPDGPGHDPDGAFAEAGRVDARLLEHILSEDWVHAPLPRSYGREQFGPTWVDGLVKAAPGLSLEDRLATLVEAEARALAWLLDDGIPRWRRALETPLRVFLTGGGRHNRGLVAAVEKVVAPARVDGIEALGEDADAKEAVDFALLGGLCFHRHEAAVAATSGAREDVVLGSIAWGRRTPDEGRSADRP